MRSLIVLALLVGVADAKPDPKRMGEAFRAYDRGDLVAAKKLAGELDDKVATRDYVLWIRGMVALRTGDIPAAQNSGIRLRRGIQMRTPGCTPHFSQMRLLQKQKNR